MRATATQFLSTLIVSAGAMSAGIAYADQAPKTHAPEILESGEATWYGPRHEGHRTSSGEIFDSHKLTAAHATLPLGSYVRVTVTDTGRSIVVKVNDREPAHGVRCIDLSPAAAARLGIVRAGVADVTLAAATNSEATELAEAPEDIAPPHIRHHLVSRAHARRHRHHAHR
jgi:rare lipoprotein A (peptidoglycan hydrolase)